MHEHAAHEIICIGPRLDGEHHVLVCWADEEICTVALEWHEGPDVWTCKSARVVGIMAGHSECLIDVLDLAITVPGVGPLGPEHSRWWQRQTGLTDLKMQRIRIAKAMVDPREVRRICGVVTVGALEPATARKGRAS